MQMRIVEGTGAKGVQCLSIEHEGEVLLWDIPKNNSNRPAATDADGLEVKYDIFEQINGYWATCKPQTQQAIFDLYVRIYKEFDSDANDVGQMITRLRPMVADLFDWHPQEDIAQWVLLKGNLMIPHSIHASFNTDTGAGTRERTYLQEDYRKLVPLAISMRLMIPIWGQFFLRTSKEVGTIFKDMHAFRLLATSNVRRCQAMQRLEVFVQHTIPKDHATSNAALLGLSSADFVEWVLAGCVVRRLSSGDVRGLPDESNLPACIWVYVTQRIKYVDDRVGKIKGKHDDSGYGNDDNNLSRMEDFKIKDPVTDGDVISQVFFLEYWANRVLSGEPITAEGCEPGYLPLPLRMSTDPAFIDVLRASFVNCEQLMNEEIHVAQRILAGWVMNKFVSARFTPYMEKVEIIRCIAFAQAYLWYNGHTDLAGLISAVSKYSTSSGEMVFADDLQKIAREQSEELAYRFPFVKPPRKSKQTRQPSDVVTAIDNVAREFADRNWFLTLPSEWSGKLTGDGRSRRYFVPRDIRTKIANLVIELDGPRPAKTMPVPGQSSI